MNMGGHRPLRHRGEISFVVRGVNQSIDVEAEVFIKHCSSCSILFFLRHNHVHPHLRGGESRPTRDRKFEGGIVVALPRRVAHLGGLAAIVRVHHPDRVWLIDLALVVGHAVDDQVSERHHKTWQSY